MRFETSTDGGVFRIKAFPVAAHGDVDVGPRYQGPYDDLKMVGDEVFFTYVPSSLDPDVVAMFCFVLFFPWIGHTVEFPHPVSDRIVNAVNLPGHQRLKGEITVNNASRTARPASDRDDPVKPAELAISFGGGIDSTALHVLYPEATLVHEVRVTEVDELPATRTQEAIEHYRATKGTPAVVVRTNSQYLSEPMGVTNWLTPLLSSVLVAADRGLRGVLVGTNLGGIFLGNGSKYVAGHRRDPNVREALGDLTVPLVQASAAITQLTATQICADGGSTEWLTFCQKAPHGVPCSKCLKCMRRELMYRVLHAKDKKRYPLSAFPVDTSQFEKKYRIERALRIFDPSQLNPYTHVFAAGRDGMRWRFPRKLRPLVAGAPDTGWMWERPPEADEMFPESFQTEIVPRIHEAIPEMTPANLEVFRGWNASG